MPSSLVKFSQRTQNGRGEKIHWGRVRAGADDLPYRGASAPMFTEDEHEVRTVRVADARNAFFDVRNEAENKQYLDVVECCFNGWFQMVHLERFWTDEDGRRTSLHYVEWVEYYLEDGSRTPYSTNGIMELSHGQPNFLGHPGAG